METSQQRPIVWVDRHNGPRLSHRQSPSTKKKEKMGVRVPVMGPNVRTYLFHPLAQVIGRHSVCSGLKCGVMDGSFDRG